jgi:hypothetical protein
MQSSDNTVEEYLAQLPEERREVVESIRRLILDHLPPGYEEALNWGMISYQVPLERYPDTYNGQPLMFAALGVQKRGYSLYLTAVYQNEAQKQRLLAAYEEMGIKPDMGKSCIRFTRLEKLPGETVAALIAETPVEQFIADYEAARGASGKGKG